MNGLDPRGLSQRLRRLLDERDESGVDGAWLEEVFAVVRELQVSRFPDQLAADLSAIPDSAGAGGLTQHVATVVADSRQLDAVSAVRGDPDPTEAWTQVLSCPVADLVIDVAPLGRSEVAVSGRVLVRDGSAAELTRVVVSEIDGPAGVAELVGERFRSTVPAVPSRVSITADTWRIRADIDFRDVGE